MKQVDLFVGVPCSGKSTYLKKHYDKNVITISIDDIRFEYAKKTGISYTEQHARPMQDEKTHPIYGENVNGKWSVLSEMNTKIHEDFFKSIRNAAKELESGKKVVVDMTNMTKKSRKAVKKWFKKVSDVDFTAVVFEFEENLELIKRQNIIRGKEQDKVIPEKVIDGMVSSFDEIEEDEGFVSVTYVDGLAGLK